MPITFAVILYFLSVTDYKHLTSFYITGLGQDKYFKRSFLALPEITGICHYLKKTPNFEDATEKYNFFHDRLKIEIFRLTLILRRSRTGTVWFYNSTSNKRAARPKLYTKSLTRDLKRMYSRFTVVRISINL